ncbi:MAG: metallophosphoesterase [Ignavibacteria bacterium]
MFVVILFSVILGLQYLVYRTFRNFLKSRYGSSSAVKFISNYPFLLFNLPYLYVIFNRFTSGTIPEWVYNYAFKPFYIFQGATIFIGLFLLIGKIIKSPFSITAWVLSKFNSTKQMLNRFRNKPAVKTVNRSRRVFIKSSAALVSGYAFTGATLGVLNSGNFEIVNKEIKIPNLPKELIGVTISLICDIHSGPYMKEDLMNEYVSAVNDLGSDFIFIPGDITNSEKTEVIPFAKSFRDLKASKGIYASLGNHDYFSDPEFIAKIISEETPIKLLRNDSEIININGKDLCILGVEDTRQSGSSYDNVLMSYLNTTVEKTKEKFIQKNLDYDTTTKVALFHKPYFFEQMNDKKLDLILSGHTHGGQVVLAKFGDLNISFAGAVSKYISGLYENEVSRMYVSRGIGSVALPIRFNCSPEITKITLV